VIQIKQYINYSPQYRFTIGVHSKKQSRQIIQGKAFFTMADVHPRASRIIYNVSYVTRAYFINYNEQHDWQGKQNENARY
jgi:hypothetical protein